MPRYRGLNDELYCIVCGEPLRDENFIKNHHCDPKVEAAVEFGRRSHEEHRERGRSLNQRLEDGYAMLELLTY